MSKRLTEEQLQTLDEAYSRFCENIGDYNIGNGEQWTYKTYKISFNGGPYGTGLNTPTVQGSPSNSKKRGIND